MRKALIKMNGVPAGVLTEITRRTEYTFTYLADYRGDAVSLTMPVPGKEFAFKSFPAFFDGLLPEGIMLEGLLREKKIDGNDCFSQLLAVGSDMPGAVTVEELHDGDMPDHL